MVELIVVVMIGLILMSLGIMGYTSFRQNAPQRAADIVVATQRKAARLAKLYHASGWVYGVMLHYVPSALRWRADVFAVKPDNRNALPVVADSASAPGEAVEGYWKAPNNAYIDGYYDYGSVTKGWLSAQEGLPPEIHPFIDMSAYGTATRMELSGSQTSLLLATDTNLRYMWFVTDEGSTTEVYSGTDAASNGIWSISTVGTLSATTIGGFPNDYFPYLVTDNKYDLSAAAAAATTARTGQRAEIFSLNGRPSALDLDSPFRIASPYRPGAIHPNGMITIQRAGRDWPLPSDWGSWSSLPCSRLVFASSTKQRLYRSLHLDYYIFDAADLPLAYVTIQTSGMAAANPATAVPAK